MTPNILTETRCPNPNPNPVTSMVWCDRAGCDSIIKSRLPGIAQSIITISIMSKISAGMFLFSFLLCVYIAYVGLLLIPSIKNTNVSYTACAYHLFSSSSRVVV